MVFFFLVALQTDANVSDVVCNSETCAVVKEKQQKKKERKKESGAGTVTSSGDVAVSAGDGGHVKLIHGSETTGRPSR